MRGSPSTERGRSRRTDRFFRAAMVLKGIDGAAELAGAVFLLLVPGSGLHRVVAGLLARDLLGPPDGSLARHLLAAADSFGSGNRTFAVAYLALHGVLKLGLVAALLRRWLRAYPVAMMVLGLFVVYEGYRAVRTASPLLGVLALIDLAVIVLVVREYRAARLTGSPERPSEQDGPGRAA